MTEYDNRNSGALFKNKKKVTEKHPDYTGQMTDAEGREHWVSAWIKQSKSGETFMSLSFNAKEQQAQSAPQPAQDTKTQAEIDDEIPF